MKDITISANTETLSAIFTDWQIKALALIPDNTHDPVGSKYVWDQINEFGISISRASVINFLNKLYGLDLLYGAELTGKGGRRLNYCFPLDREFFNTRVSSMLLESIVGEYPKVDHFKMLRLIYEARDLNNP